MEDSPSPRGFAFDGPALYRIRVEGRIRPSWFDRLEGMAISLCAPEGETQTTTLVGELRDQASLTGLIMTLYELHLPVLLVECLSTRQATAGA